MKRLLLLLALVLVLAGCGKESFVLLPDLDGKVGAISVSPEQGEPVVVNTAYTAVEVGSKSEAGQPEAVSQERVQRMFAQALKAAPQRPARFILYFFHDSTRLKPKSAKLLSQVVQAWKDRASTDVSVIGHTDSMGDATYNYGLSLRRAKRIGKQLVKRGLPADIVQIISHGEENPLVPTADGVSEPKNRRVEVIVR